MQIPHYISSPLVGGIVGYITSWIAIKMFFLPRKPVMIGRFRLPFTPGIVPKRKDALAEILGNAVVEKFLMPMIWKLFFNQTSSQMPLRIPSLQCSPVQTLNSAMFTELRAVANK